METEMKLLCTTSHLSIGVEDPVVWDGSQRVVIPIGLVPNAVLRIAGAEISRRLSKIESMLGEVLIPSSNSPSEKDYHTTEEFAELVKRKPWTIRQRCNEGRIEAKKSPFAREVGGPTDRASHHR